MRNRTLKRYGKEARTPHTEGLVQNYGPRRARTRRELARLVANVRKVLHRSKDRLILWVERDLAQARAHGSGFFARAKFDSGRYAGTSWAVGNRALLVLRGRTPA